MRRCGVEIALRGALHVLGRDGRVGRVERVDAVEIAGERDEVREPAGDGVGRLQAHQEAVLEPLLQRREPRGVGRRARGTAAIVASITPST